MTGASSDIAAGIVIRLAGANEVTSLVRRIAAPARALGRSFYDEWQIQAVIARVFGVVPN